MVMIINLKVNFCALIFKNWWFDHLHSYELKGFTFNMSFYIKYLQKIDEYDNYGQFYHAPNITIIIEMKYLNKNRMSSFSPKVELIWYWGLCFFSSI